MTEQEIMDRLFDLRLKVKILEMGLRNKENIEKTKEYKKELQKAKKEIEMFLFIYFCLHFLALL